MEKEMKLLMGALAVLAIVFVLTQGEITGKATACSEKPEFTTVKVVGNTVSLNWEDTSTFKGQARYELAIFKQQEDGSYNFNEAADIDTTITKSYMSFLELKEGKYVVRLRAKNPGGCSEGYTGYTTSKEVETITE